MRSILLLPLVARCLETIDVCIWRMFVVVTVWGSVGMFVVWRPLLKIVGFCILYRVLKYVVCLYKGCDRCCVFCLYCDAWSCRCSCMGSMSVRHADGVCLCASCGSSQCSVLHDMQFVNAGRGCKRRPYGTEFELLEFVFDSVYVDLQYNEISLTFTAGPVLLGCVCGHVDVFGLSVRLSWYPMWMRRLL